MRRLQFNLPLNIESNIASVKHAWQNSSVMQQTSVIGMNLWMSFLLCLLLLLLASPCVRQNQQCLLWRVDYIRSFNTDEQLLLWPAQTTVVLLLFFLASSVTSWWWWWWLSWDVMFSITILVFIDRIQWRLCSVIILRTLIWNMSSTSYDFLGMCSRTICV